MIFKSVVVYLLFAIARELYEIKKTIKGITTGLATWYTI